jgi:hypothetical protein
MEIKASLFTFDSPDAAKQWIDSVVGASNLDASGVLVGYLASTGQYYGFFVAANYAGIVFCVSTTPGAAASRACESPFGGLIGAWQQSLTGGTSTPAASPSPQTTPTGV